MSQSSEQTFPFTVNFVADGCKDDRGPNNRYPKGTVSQLLLFRSKEKDTELWMKIYFTPDGGREFLFEGKNNVADTYPEFMPRAKHGIAPKVCFSPVELNLMFNAIDWLGKNTEQVYPKTHR